MPVCGSEKPLGPPLTTDPDHHSGEGIFFSSRVFDGFEILSGGVFFSHEFGDEEDWLLERHNPQNGTSVFMKLNNHTLRQSDRRFQTRCFASLRGNIRGSNSSRL